MMSSGDAGDDLPDELATAAGLRLMGVTGAARREALAALLAEHPQHAAGLRRLLADIDRVDGVLAASWAAPVVADEPLSSVGGHRVIRRLGEGAFGVVYLCAQERPVTREVAVKVVRAGAGSPESLRRFAAERQLLAALNHPTITQVFDAGELADGRPYFVMEYVPGTPLCAYCEARQLGIRDRLRLFCQVCRGVAHAHARGIVHRDLKPANVLVVDTDGGPLPKIIDFGVAKALAVGAGASGPATEAGRVVGTPGYMSPEQATGHSEAIDARADVFALGVLFYELLTGELPWAAGVAASTGEPLRPSTRVATTANAAAADARRPWRQRIAALRGDLDWIALKALAREREQRYPTVADFVADVQSHLDGGAVSVGPPSLRYRAGKFARRNRTPLVVGGVALLLVATLGIYFQLHLADAEAAADRAVAQATLAVEKLLARANDERLRQASENDGVRQLLAQDALAFYELWLRDRPSERRLRIGRCRTLVSLSAVHWQLGQLPDAERTAGEAVGEARELLAAAPEEPAMRGLLAESLRRHGRALISIRRSGDALPMLREAIRHLETCAERAPGEYTLSLSSAWRELASAHEEQQQLEACIDAGQHSVDVLDRHVAAGPVEPRTHTDLALARCVQARLLFQGKRADAAIALAAAAEAGLPLVTVDLHRVTARVHALRADLASRRGDWPLAVAQAKLAVAAGERWQQQEPTRIAPRDVLIHDLRYLAAACERVTDWPGADQAMQRAIAVVEASITDFPADAMRRVLLDEVLQESAFRLYERLRQPDLPQAQAWIERALAAQAWLLEHGAKTRRPPAQTRTLLAMVLAARGAATPATWEDAAAGLTIDAEVTAADHELDFAGWMGAAESRLRQGELDGAQSALAQAMRWVGEPPVHKSQACQVEQVKARIALRRGDVDAAVVAAQRILELRPTWMGRWQAADCHFAVQQQVAATAGAEATTATTARAEAARLYRLVVDELAAQARAHADDPWFVVPWGFASVQLAQLEMAAGHAEAARALLEPALPALERVESLAHRDVWQPETMARGRELAAALRSRDRR